MHFLPTGYSPVHNAVSDYGADSYSSLFRISLWSSSTHGTQKRPAGLLAGAVLVGLVLVVAMLLPRLRRVFGLCGRFFLAVTYVWLVLVALQLAVKAA